MFPGRSSIAVFMGCLILCSVGGRTAAADVVVLKNGDTITGKITGGEKGTIVLSTDYSAPISIRTNTIKKISTEGPVEVRQKDGTTLKGTLTVTEDGRLAIGAAEGGAPTVVNWDSIESFNPPPSAWSGSIALGVNSQSGNTRRVSASAGADALWKAPADRVGVRFLYNYAEDTGKLSARNTFGAAKYEHLFSRYLYAYVDAEMLSDKFRDLLLRTAAGPGAGYQVWDLPSITLSFEVGLSYFNEDHVVGADDAWYTLRAAGTFTWNIDKALAFKEYFEIYARLNKNDNYKTRNEASITSALRSNLALKASNIIEYDRTPTPGIQRMDIFWILSLLFTF